MNLKNKIASLVLIVAAGMIMNACQKLDRPELGELILDPPPPPYSTLKSFRAFENNAGDSGQYRTKGVAKNITYVAGINGQAAKIGADGYLVITTLNDSMKTPGSFTLAFWMNGVGPVQGGAQGLFAISNNKQFWGNLEIFLENLNNGAEAFLKVHLFNANAADGKGEQWNEVKIPGALNKWTHIAITYNAANSQFTIYADGAPTAINNKVLSGGNYGQIKWADVGGMVLGTYAFQTSPSLTNHGPESWARSFNGALDQVRFYFVALSPTEVNALYTQKN